MSRIVVIDDDRSVREAFRMVFKDAHDIATFGDGASALDDLREQPANLVFLDILLGKENGIDVLQQIQLLRDPPAVVMVTATRTVKTAVEAMKRGAFEYVTKPWDLEDLQRVARRAIEHRQQQRDLAALRRQVEESKLRFTRELERQVAERTRALETANAQLVATRDQLIRSEKLASLGELVAGVAHELNNKLSPILAYAQLLGEFDFPGRIPKYIRTMERSAEGASAVVKALLSFARQSEPTRREIQLNDLLEDTLLLVQYHLKSGAILVDQQLGDGMPAIMADDKQLGQVFLNIMNNACQAMGERGGTLTIRSWADDTHVHFEFRDTGPGISEQHVAKVFDPFFTTKPQGKGTGLGLSVSYGIVKAHGGDIQVETVVGQGTRFHITLPCTLADDRPSVPVGTPKPRRAQPGGRVLVVDDDVDCRTALEDILSPQHEVVLAADAQQGRAYLEKDPGFDAVLVDCRMPGESGMDLYEWLRTHAAQVAERCVFVTGDYAKPDIQDFLNRVGRPWIPKPLEVETVRNAVAQRVAGA